MINAVFLLLISFCVLRASVVITLLLSVSLLLPCVGSAQKDKPKNLEGFEQKIVHFGFTIGLNSADFILDYDHNEWTDTSSNLLSLESQRQPGFNLGIVSDLHLGSLLNLRFIPQLSFAGRMLEYTVEYNSKQNNGQTTQLINKPVESTYIDFPLDLKFRSARINNYACYLLGGGKYSIDLASQADIDQNIGDPVVRIERYGFSWEVGFGMDFFLQYFKFSPEIKLSVGTKNLIIHDAQSIKYETVIDRMRSNILLLSFTFEG